ncbi:MAG: phosphate/phosphite/phosphonate ABC transporter substrate-binding protein, partial [Thiohalobacterales bacterium]|nr:phosphate/phosphite/phosphonate ABC transporter substrate-binding protein [Thiohalobacterales bacterium]
MRSRLIRVITGIIGCVWCVSAVMAGSGNEAPERTYSFAIVPQQAPSKLLKSWGPVLRYLQEQTGHRFIFRTAPDIPTFEDRVRAGEYDFAYMNPYHFTVFNRGDEGYQAVARARDKLIRGIIVVPRNSTIESLADLEGKELAFPAPGAFAASVLPRANLTAAGIKFDAKYVSSHDSVYQSVARGLYPAGGGVERTLNATDPAVREQLRILWKTPGYTPHAIAARQDVPVDVVDAVRQALV